MSSALGRLPPGPSPDRRVRLWSSGKDATTREHDMRFPVLFLTSALLIAAAPALAAPLPPRIAAAAADPARAADKALDAHRHGPELMAFARVKPGDKVLELIPASGYFTRLFSRIVGPAGRVY